MAGMLVLLGIVLFVLGVVALFKPLPRIWLRSRGMAAVAMVLGVGSCVAGGAMMPPVTEEPNRPSPPDDRSAEAPAAKAKARPNPMVKITAEEYAQISSGMTYEQVVEIIGEPGEEISSSDVAGISTVAYSWQNFNGSNAMLMFQDDALIQKSQFGL